MTPPLVVVDSVVKSYRTGPRTLRRGRTRREVVRDVSFAVERGTTLGIVGETGAGKSTVGRMLLGLVRPDSGTVAFEGSEVGALRRRELRGFRQRAQMIFQDPFASLDPRMVIRDIVGEPLLIHRSLRGRELEERTVALLERVGVRPDQLDRYPREFSGGQLQRIAIARALSTEPDLIVCDEPVAALDVSIQAQVLNLLLDLQRERGLAYVFISHDLALVRLLSDHVLVMRDGEVVEQAPTERIFEAPQQDYTRRLIASMVAPRPSARAQLLAETDR